MLNEEIYIGPRPVHIDQSHWMGPENDTKLKQGIYAVIAKLASPK